MKIFFVGMLLLCLNFSLNAQVRDVTGIVKDSKTKEVLPGVSIGLKGGKVGTQTDINGFFRLRVDNASSQILICRYLGYKEIAVNVEGKNQVEVLLESESLLLKEVVSIGYATVDRRDVTGSISSISERQLRDIPISSVEQALTGRLAGIQVTTSEGTPDAEVKIRVRGGSSITQDNAPIYIIDGVQVEEGLKGMAVQDIESIDVLKDASSTSIYGARGANGVVIITTKQGVAARTKVSYNPIFGVSKVARTLSVQSPYEFVLYQDEKSRLSEKDSLGFISNYGNDLSIYKNYPSIDWQEQMFGRNAIQQTHNLSISGGGKDTRFNLSYTNNNQDGIMKKSSYKRDLVNLKLDHTLTSKFKVGAIVRYNRETVNGAGVSSTSSSTFNLLRNTIKYQPMIISDTPLDSYDEDYFLESGGTSFALINPIALNNAKELIRKNNMLNVNGSLEYKFNKVFSFRSIFGFNFMDQSRDNFDSEITPQARYTGDRKAMLGKMTSSRRTFNNSNVFNYNNTFNKVHRLNLLLGHELYNISYESLDVRMRFFPHGITAEKALNQLGLGEVQDGYPRNDAYESKVVSFFTRANYTYKNRYLFTASLRADGSSKFAPSNRWGYFPAASAAWQISRESFMKGVTTVTDLKLRASYGLAGNNRIKDYMYMGAFMSGANYYLDNKFVNGYYYTDLPNENLKWEKTISRNLGVDMTLFKGLRFSIDAYSNLTDDLLIDLPIPSSSGYSKQLQNVGKTEAKGLEIQFGGVPLRTNDFVWNTDFNIAFNRNKVKRISGWKTSQLYQSGVFNGPPSDYILQEGSPVGLMYGYVTDGFYTVDDFDYDAATKIYTLKSGVVNSSSVVGLAQPGTMKLKDFSGNNNVDAEDQMVIGNANPKFSGGLNNQFKYKNFDLSVFVNFVYGNDVYNASKLEFSNGYSRYTNMLELMNDRWRTVDPDGVKVQWLEGNIVKGAAPEVLSALNADAKIWQPGTTTASGFLPSSWAIEDGSFLRLNNVTLGYTLSNDLLKKLKLYSCRLYVTGTNLALWTNYTGYDPEVDTRRATPLTPSVDYSAYPRSRSFLFGLNLTL
ncbi:SusC/RagA family TonB-linked outer membrane protein [Pseudopedobacter beijingensis]|uniref:SusC/RagA family TonB-linked outer membrane protein n=1 Tax=Pseudopedobacter beijingensis TaxID=1207056 RepID=A0ABW4IH57_9SPHI